MTIKNVFRWHLWLGLLSGIFLLLIGTTGSIAVLAEEIDWLLLPPLRAQPAADSRRASADTLVANVRAAHPQARLVTLDLSQRPYFAHVAQIQERAPEGGRRRNVTVFLDPATGAIQGERELGSGYTASVYQFIRQSHVRLLMGFWGRVFVGICGVTLTLSCITGLWIYRGWIKKLFQLRLKGSWGSRSPWAELHKFVGVWSLVFNVILGVTGAFLGLENLANKLEEAFAKKSPAVEAKVAAAARLAKTAAKPGATGVAVAPPLSLDALLARAATEFPDLRVRSITFPNRPTDPISFRGGVPNPFVADSHVRSASGLSLNPVTGEVVRLTDGRKLSFGARLYWLQDPLHFGYFGGLLSKIPWFFLGLTPGLLALSGTWMWWKRRAHAAKPASPAAAEATSALPAWLPWGATVLTLAGAYTVVALAFGNARFSHVFAEHWLVKPVALALAAFPVTGLFVWLVGRARRLAPAAFAWLLLGGWFVFLSSLFPPR